MSVYDSYSHAPGQKINLQFWLTILWSSLLYTQFVWSMPGSREEDLYRKAQEPFPVGHEIYDFDRP